MSDKAGYQPAGHRPIRGAVYALLGGCVCSLSPNRMKKIHPKTKGKCPHVVPQGGAVVRLMRKRGLLLFFVGRLISASLQAMSWVRFCLKSFTDLLVLFLREYLLCLPLMRWLVGGTPAKLPLVGKCKKGKSQVPPLKARLLSQR
jgi:hypothetical protein